MVARMLFLYQWALQLISEFTAIKPTEEQKVRSYGIPRNDDVANPDKADLRAYGRGAFKNKAAKAATRRYFKRSARAAGKLECLEGGEDV